MSNFIDNFYTRLYDALLEKVQNNDFYYEDICEGNSIGMDCYVGDLYITCEVCYTTELHDDSFDHLFGVWHDPHPYYEADGIEDIADVHIYESDDKDAPEIEGFSYDDFWAPYEKDTVILYSRTSSNKRVKAGDKLLYCGKHEVEFLAYNEMKELCKVRYEDGSIHYTQSRFLKAQEKVSAA